MYTISPISHLSERRYSRGRPLDPIQVERLDSPGTSTPAHGHTLVVPRRHTPSYVDLIAEEIAALGAASQRVARALRACLPTCAGVTLTLADGEVAGQEVMHAHMHVIPPHRSAGPGPGRMDNGVLYGTGSWFEPCSFPQGARSLIEIDDRDAARRSRSACSAPRCGSWTATWTRCSARRCRSPRVLRRGSACASPARRARSV